MKNGYIFPLDSNSGGNPGATVKKKFELIEEITITTDGVTVIERDTDLNDVPYSFEDVYIRFEMEPTSATGTANFVSWANKITSCGIGSLISTSKKFSSIRYQIVGGLLFSTFQSATGDKTWASAKQLDGDVIFTDEIFHLKFTCNIPIPIGSKITIYGMRK